MTETAGPYHGRVLEVSYGKAKAVWATVLGFIGPGAGILLNEVRPGGDGIQGSDLAYAGLFCLVAAAGGGLTVYNAKNRPKVVDAGPAA